MDEDLPREFEIIVLGTGMTDSILAAAAARVGHSVLHMDRYDYYGSSWATFNFDTLLKWINQNQNTSEECAVNQPDESLLEEDETFILCREPVQNIFNVKDYCYVRESLPVVPESAHSTNEIKILNKEVAEEAASALPIENDAKPSTSRDEPELLPTETLDEGTSISSKKTEIVEVSPSEVYDATASSTISDSSGPSKISAPEAVAGSSTESDCDLDIPGPSTSSIPDPVGPSTASDPALSPSSNVKHKEWTLAEIKTLWRKFNIDLAPKVLFSRGSLVDLLISSNISRYAEFKAVTRVLTYLNGKLEQVPCSRADVFSTKEVTIVEKRMLMKLLTFCSDYEKHPEEYRGFEDSTFIDFLKSKRLTSNVLYYVLYAIAMANDSKPLLEGLAATQRFLKSLGRYGNTPFLWPMYGSGELPQCFCRLCAVFGGIYFLNRDVEAIVVNNVNQCQAIITRGKRINCRQLVMSYSFSRMCWLPENSTIMRISRGIFITNKSILSAEKEQVTLLQLPAKDGIQVPITVLELGPGTMACPDGLYIVQMTCRCILTAEVDLEPAVRIMFTRDQDLIETSVKPRILWCLYFEQVDTTQIDLNAGTPSNVTLTAGPGDHLDLDNCVHEARSLYERMYPGEEFLPRAPDPEEIVIEEVGNPHPAEVVNSGGDGTERENTADNVPAVPLPPVDYVAVNEANPDAGDPGSSG